LAIRGRGTPETKSPFDFFSVFCTGSLLTFLVYLYPLKSYSTFFIWLENSLWGQNLGDFEPFSEVWWNWNPKKLLAYAKPRRLRYQT
jgi:hypothetical protein